jgi:xanthine dehydrogenase small subunit
MRNSIPSMALLEPLSVTHALELLRDEPALTPLAGCTDLYVQINFGTMEQRRFLNLWSLRELSGISVSNDTLRIGALTTYTTIIGSSEVQQRLPMLIAAAREVGGVQIQNRGTLGGNVANGSPAGDTLPVLAAADAMIVLQSADGERRVAFTSFYTGYRATVMRPDEIITAFEIPVVEGTQWFRKVGTRAAQAISKIVMAGVRSDAPRVALGSVGPTVLRLTRTEKILANGGAIEDAARALEEEIHPIDDIRSTAEYRRRVSSNLLRRFWADTAG